MKAYDFLHELLVTEFGVQPKAINPDATLPSLGLDSLSIVELVDEVERHFDIVIPDEQADFATLGAAAAAVDSLIEAKQG